MARGLLTAGLVAVIVVVALGARPAPEPGPADPGQLERLVRDDYVDAFVREDADRWLGLFADDAIALHHESPAAEGKSAIAGLLDSFRAEFRVLDMQVTVEEVRISGNWALTWGYFTERFAPRAATGGPAEVTNVGRYLLLWERQSDGHWRIIADMGNRG